MILCKFKILNLSFNKLFYGIKAFTNCCKDLSVLYWGQPDITTRRFRTCMSAAGLGFEPSQNNAFRERRATTTLARIIYSRQINFNLAD